MISIYIGTSFVWIKFWLTGYTPPLVPCSSKSMRLRKKQKTVKFMKLVFAHTNEGEDVSKKRESMRYPRHTWINNANFALCFVLNLPEVLTSCWQNNNNTSRIIWECGNSLSPLLRAMKPKKSNYTFQFIPKCRGICPKVIHIYKTSEKPLLCPWAPSILNFL